MCRGFGTSQGQCNLPELELGASYTQVCKDTLGAQRWSSWKGGSPVSCRSLVAGRQISGRSCLGWRLHIALVHASGVDGSLCTSTNTTSTQPNKIRVLDDKSMTEVAQLGTRRTRPFPSATCVLVVWWLWAILHTFLNLRFSVRSPPSQQDRCSILGGLKDPSAATTHQISMLLGHVMGV